VAPDCGLRGYPNESSCSTHEPLSEAMSEFQRDGVIEIRKRKTFIFDRETLSQRARDPSGLCADGQIRI
jgi:hypothetical protein